MAPRPPRDIGRGVSLSPSHMTRLAFSCLEKGSRQRLVRHSLWSTAVERKARLSDEAVLDCYRYGFGAALDA